MGFIAPEGNAFPGAKPICHLDRSEAEWRDLRFLFSSHADSLAPEVRLSIVGGKPRLEKG
jgi:hypothetical protein